MYKVLKLKQLQKKMKTFLIPHHTVQQRQTVLTKHRLSPQLLSKKTTTKKKVVTTKKPETTTANSKKLPQYSPEAEIVALFNKVNNYRVQNGLSKIAMDPDICKMAYIRAQEQKSLKGHDRPDGSKYYTILDEYNYKYSGCGKNIAFIWNVSADEAFNKWKDSPSHNQNMLDSHWTKAGIAMCRNADDSYSIVNIFAC